MMRIAMAQSCPPAVPSTLNAHVAHLIRRAAEGRADVIVFPELYSPGFHLLMDRQEGDTLPQEFRDRAEPVPGPLTQAIGALAGEYGIQVIFTMLEYHAADDSYRSAAILIAADGSPLLVHRKTMLTPRIDAGITPGDSYDVVDTESARVGILICADATCPEPARIMALKGAEIVFVCSGDFRSPWLVGERDLVEQFWYCCSASPSRAVDNAVFWVAVNGAGWQGGAEFFGGSRVIAPDGSILAQAPSGGSAEALVLVDLDLSLKTKVESTFSLMHRRRPELYGTIAKNQPSDPSRRG